MAKTITGTVFSTKMDKTAVIVVVSKMRHPQYRKVIVKSKKFKAHSGDMQVTVGDVVQIQETRPIAKTVHFKIVKKI